MDSGIWTRVVSFRSVAANSTRHLPVLNIRPRIAYRNATTELYFVDENTIT